MRGIGLVRIVCELFWGVHGLDSRAQALYTNGLPLSGDLPVRTQLSLKRHELAHEVPVGLNDLSQPGHPIFLLEY